jgi:hypothetical protein
MGICLLQDYEKESTPTLLAIVAVFFGVRALLIQQ